MEKTHLFREDTEEYLVTITSEQFGRILKCGRSTGWEINSEDTIVYPSTPRAKYGWYITDEEYEMIKLALIEEELRKEVICG